MPRQAVDVPVVIERDELRFQDLVEGLSVTAVGDVVADVTGPLGNPETIRAVVCLCPPAVEDGEIQRAVEDRLLAARARGLQGRRGLLSHTSTPCTRCRATLIS